MSQGQDWNAPGAQPYQQQQPPVGQAYQQPYQQQQPPVGQAYQQPYPQQAAMVPAGAYRHAGNGAANAGSAGLS